MGVKPVLLTAVTVATAGTRVQVNAGSQYCTRMDFEGKLGNAGAVFIGDNTVSANKYVSALTAGQHFTMSLGGIPTRPSDINGGAELQLNSIYVDAATSGSIVMVTYFPRVSNS